MNVNSVGRNTHVVALDETVNMMRVLLYTSKLICGVAAPGFVGTFNRICVH